MSKLRAEKKVQLFLIGGNSWEIRDLEGNVLKDCEDDFFIYMRSVNLKNGNLIEGRYLGELKKNSPILDDQCKEVTFDDNSFYMDGKVVKTARMLAINNKTKVIMVIANN